MIELLIVWAVLGVLTAMLFAETVRESYEVAQSLAAERGTAVPPRWLGPAIVVVFWPLFLAAIIRGALWPES